MHWRNCTELDKWSTDLPVTYGDSKTLWYGRKQLIVGYLYLLDLDGFTKLNNKSIEREKNKRNWMNKKITPGSILVYQIFNN